MEPSKAGIFPSHFLPPDVATIAPAVIAPVRVAPSPSVVTTPTGVPLGVVAEVGIVGLDGGVRARGLRAGLLGVLGHDMGDGQGGDESE